MTAATGVTVSAPSTTERSGNLSYTPTEAAHLAVLVLDGAGVSATAIAASINDAVETVAAHPMVEANVSSGPSTADILQSAISIASDRTGTIGAALDALDAIDAAVGSSNGGESTVAAAVYGVVGSAARLVDGIFAHLIIQFDWEYVRHKDVEVRYSPTTTGKAYGAVDLVDSSTSVYDFYEIKPRTEGGRTDGLAQRKNRVADFLNPIAVANLSANAQGPAATAVRAGTTYGTCVTCEAFGLSVTQTDVRDRFQDGLVFYEWDSVNPVTVGVTAGAAARIARNVRPGAGVIIDVNKPRPLPLPPVPA